MPPRSHISGESLAPFLLSTFRHSSPSSPFPAIQAPSTPSLPSPTTHVSSQSHKGHPADNTLWQCSLGCGKRYEKSSGRSIRHHMTSCFRSHWPGAKEMSDNELQELMSAKQEGGQLVTGFRRWRKRQCSRSTLELSNVEKWICPRGCRQIYRITSSRSIHKHTTKCSSRPSAEGNSISSDDSISCPPTPASNHDMKQADKLRTSKNEFKLSYSPTLLRIPSQYDGFEEHLPVDLEGNLSENTTLQETSGDSGSCHPLSLPSRYPVQVWEDTPLRELLRRQQLETEQLSANHFTAIVALSDGSSMAPWSSTPSTDVPLSLVSPFHLTY
jgi:hypothetical protein